MKKLSRIFLLAMAVHMTYPAAAQSRREHCVMFYNTENLFHPSNDSAVADDDFTSEGVRHWNFYRYKRKIAAICKVILASNGWEPPDAICLSEIENRQVLDDIIFHPLMLGHSYRPLHRDSPDHRGIDVGILYRQDRMDCMDTSWIEIRNASDELVRTREILVATFRLKGTGDTVVICANHWTSKYGGALETEGKRLLQSRLLGEYIDAVLNNRRPDGRIGILHDAETSVPPDMHRISIIAGGDLNDLSGSAPVQLLTDTFHLEEVLPGMASVAGHNIRVGAGAVHRMRVRNLFSGIPREAGISAETEISPENGISPETEISPEAGISPETEISPETGISPEVRTSLEAEVPPIPYGSYKYQGSWGSIDHVFVGGRLHAGNCHARIFSHPLLLEEDTKYTGKKPFRTYSGFSYHGGISDHLPLLLHFVVPDVQMSKRKHHRNDGMLKVP